MVRLAVFQNIHHASEIMLEKLPTAEPFLHAGQHAWIGCGVDHPVGNRNRFEVAGCANVTMNEGHTKLPKADPVNLRTRAHQIVNPGN